MAGSWLWETRLVSKGGGGGNEEYGGGESNELGLSR